MRDVRRLLLSHVLSDECHSFSPPPSTVGCLNVRRQVISFPDADMHSYPLSITCLTNGIHRNTLLLVLEMCTGQSLDRNCSLHLLQMKLRQYIFNLRRGYAIFHSVLFALRSKANVCELSEIQNSWPIVSDSRSKDTV